MQESTSGQARVDGPLLAASSRDEEGAAAVEYGLLVGLIAAVIIGIVITLGLSVEGLYDSVVTAWQDA